MAHQFDQEIHDKDFIEALSEESTVNLREGMRVKGIVINADEKGISLNIGQKKDGFIYADETGLDEYSPSSYHKGQELEAVVIPAIQGEKDYINLSKRKIDVVAEGDKQVDLIRNGEIFELKITSSADGDKGLLGKLGNYTIFIPASQIKIERVKETKKYVGKHLRVIATEIDDDKKKIIASARKLLEEEKKAREELFWANVTPDVIVTGKVKRLADFGAFVSVDGIDCLAHVSDLAYGKVKSPDEIVKVGESYDFLVLTVDPSKKRVSLSLKALAKHPFEVFTEANPIGSTVKGKVMSIVPFGVFLSLTKGVEGLVHVSEVSHTFIKTPADVVKVGQEVDALIKEIHPDRRKISLSIKALIPEPTEEEIEAERLAKEAEKMAKRGGIPSEAIDGEALTPKKSQIDKFESRMAEAEKSNEEAVTVEGEMPIEAVEGETTSTVEGETPKAKKKVVRSTLDTEPKPDPKTRTRGGASRPPREPRPPRDFSQGEGTGQGWQDESSANNLFASLLKGIEVDK